MKGARESSGRNSITRNRFYRANNRFVVKKEAKSFRRSSTSCLLEHSRSSTVNDESLSTLPVRLQSNIR